MGMHFMTSIFLLNVIFIFSFFSIQTAFPMDLKRLPTPYDSKSVYLFPGTGCVRSVQADSEGAVCNCSMGADSCIPSSPARCNGHSLSSVPKQGAVVAKLIFAQADKGKQEQADKDKQEKVKMLEAVLKKLLEVVDKTEAEKICKTVIDESSESGDETESPLSANSPSSRESDDILDSLLRKE